MSRAHKAIPLGSRLVRRESESGKEAALDRAYKRGSILVSFWCKTRRMGRI